MRSEPCPLLRRTTHHVSTLDTLPPHNVIPSTWEKREERVVFKHFLFQPARNTMLFLRRGGRPCTCLSKPVSQAIGHPNRREDRRASMDENLSHTNRINTLPPQRHGKEPCTLCRTHHHNVSIWNHFRLCKNPKSTARRTRTLGLWCSLSPAQFRSRRNAVSSSPLSCIARVPPTE